MIRQITDPDKLVSNETDYYSEKIKAYKKAYGVDYDFCRFYSVSQGLSTGYVMLLNSSAVISGKTLESTELSEFISLYAPTTIECPVYLANRMKFEGYTRYRRLLFELKDDLFFDEDEFKKELDDPVSLQQMFIIMNSCFNGLEYDGWYADMSHRIRHEMSEVFMYKGITCATLDFKAGKTGYISGLATMPTERGKGYATDILKYLAGMLKRQRIQGYVWAMEGAMPYYRSLGFSPADEDVYLVRKGTDLFC